MIIDGEFEKKMGLGPYNRKTGQDHARCRGYHCFA